MSWISPQPPPHLTAPNPGLTGTFLMWPSNRCSIWAMSRFWGSRKNWMTSRREFSSPRSWVGRVNHSLEVKVGVKKLEITSVLSIVVISICENVCLQVPDDCGNMYLYWQVQCCIYAGVFTCIYWISGYEHNCVCVSVLMDMTMCVIPCGYVIELVNILERGWCVEASVWQSSFLGGWVGEGESEWVCIAVKVSLV